METRFGGSEQYEETKNRIEETIKEQGLHRSGGQEGPFSIHLLGLGKTGASVIERYLRDLPEGAFDDPDTRFTALAVDIGSDDLEPIQEAAKEAGLPEDRTQIRSVGMEVPSKDDLMASLRRYPEYLKREFPRYYWNPNYEPWMPSDIEMPEAGDHVPRAIAKAIYGREYYEDGPVAEELEAFAQSVEASESTSIVLVCFGLGGGTGSGIVVDLARHLSNIKLGRRQLVVGVGVLPCDGDSQETKDGRLFPVLSELDCMLDKEKNEGTMAVWGDLYRNPFTGGFLTIPQEGIYELTGDLSATHDKVDEGLASFVAEQGGVHLWETLKLTNWLNAPSFGWHPAMRAAFDANWLNVLTSVEAGSADKLGATLGATFVDGSATEYAEARVFGSSEESVAAQISSNVDTIVEPDVLTFETNGRPSFVHAYVPRVSKLGIADFYEARDAYDAMDWDEKMMSHSWLLDLGVLLCEPSIRFEGMGGECIWGCACWVVVPHDAIRGKVEGIELTI